MSKDLKLYKHYIVTPNHAYVLDNWEELEEWYKLPFYKKWFIKKPIKELSKTNKYDLDNNNNSRRF